MKKVFDPEVESLISSLRGFPEERSDMKDRGAKGFGSLVETCVERYHIGRKTPEEAVLENWEAIIGRSFARRCRPERIDAGGTLVVQAANATVRRELIFMEDRILTALGSIEGCQHIHRVILKAGQ